MSSLNKLLNFNVSHFTYWKQKVRDFTGATDINMWDIIKSGYKFLKILIDGVYQPKMKSLWIEEEWKRHLLAFTIKWIITNSLTLNEYERISNFTTIKKVWDTLEVAYIRIT